MLFSAAMFNLTPQFIVFALLNLVDAINTVTIVEKGGTNLEANPVPRFFMEQAGTPLILYLYKAIIVAAVIGLCWYCAKTRDRSIRAIMLITNIVFGLVCIWGTYVVYHIS